LRRIASQEKKYTEKKGSGKEKETGERRNWKGRKKDREVDKGLSILINSFTEINRVHGCFTEKSK
jgi:hypothetical protein